MKTDMAVIQRTDEARYDRASAACDAARAAYDDARAAYATARVLCDEHAAQYNAAFRRCMSRFSCMFACNVVLFACCVRIALMKP